MAVLAPHAPANGHELAGYLIDLGRVEDALAVLQRPTAPPDSWGGSWHDRPPF